jgi:hypothetical protein
MAVVAFGWVAGAACRPAVRTAAEGPEGRTSVRMLMSLPGRPLTSDDCHLAFRAAVQAAVKDWKFAPAFRQKPVPGPDPRAPIMHWEQSPVAIYIDFEFSFQVVHGKGVRPDTLIPKEHSRGR